MLSQEAMQAREILEEHENNILKVIEENDCYTIELWQDPFAYKQCMGFAGSRYIEIFFNDSYSSNLLLDNDIYINAILRKYNTVDTLWLKSYMRELNMSFSHIFNKLENIKTLKTLKYFKAEEYKNIYLLSNLENLELCVYGIENLDFTRLKYLKRCTILMKKHYSTKEQINEARKYIKKQESMYKKIQFSLLID